MNVHTKPFLPTDRLEHEKISAIAELAWQARAAAAVRSMGFDAHAWLAANGCPEKIRRKAAIGAGSTTNNVLGNEGVAIGPFSDAMRTTSAFFRIFSDNGFLRLPFHTRAAVAVSAPSAGVVGEGAAIGVSQTLLNNVQLLPIKVGGMLVVTNELLLDTGAAGQACFSRMLQAVVGAAADTAFVDIIDNGLSPIASTAPNKDVRAALTAVNTAGLARLYWLAAEDVAKFASTLATMVPAFVAASATGGSLAGLPLLTSSGIGSGKLYLVNAAQVGADGGPATIEASGQSDVLMDTAPPMSSTTPTAAQMVSMFATDSSALRCLAVMGAARLRTDAAAVITGITTTTWAA